MRSRTSQPLGSKRRFFHGFRIRILGILSLLILVPLLVIGRVYYVRFSHLIDVKLQERKEGIQSGIYAAPVVLVPGKKYDLLALVQSLERIGYRRSPLLDQKTSMGYRIPQDATVEVKQDPDPLNPAAPDWIEVTFRFSKISSLVALPARTPLQRFELMPELITNLTGKSREKRKFIRYEELPPHLIQAVLAAEDKRFFSHIGLDPLRILKALAVNARAQEVEQGGSTLTQQFIKNFFLTQERTWERKITEAFMALMLERRLSKEEILELYVNEVYLGQRGTFGIIGFGKAAKAFFNKEVKDLTVGEAAMLASSISAPNRYNAYRYPDLVLKRRNLLLDRMEELGYISVEQKIAAKKEALNVKPTSQFNYSDAPYFADFVDEQLGKVLPAKSRKQYYRIYTTLDSDLQKAAYQAMRVGLAELDERLANSKSSVPPGTVQASLLAINPKNGHILAYLGGRNYSTSQYNRIVASKRQPGSIFKPFVYAAALETAYTRPHRPITIATTLVDRPVVFESDVEYYAPKNYKEEYKGLVNLRKALSKSLNLATIKLAEKVGFENVVDLAKRAGLSEDIKPFPSMAIGTFEVTVLEIVRAYTAFINEGMTIQPVAIREIIGPDGKIVYRAPLITHSVMSPQAAYLVTNMLETTLNAGTGVRARARGFTLPAAGKTGTSFDGWFAGFTPDLLCIVWVGFDDNRPLGLSGAQSALPIWAEFMKKAAGLIPLSGATFTKPEGIVEAEIDPVTGLLATPRCLERQKELFIEGTQPTLPCTGNNYETLFANPYPSPSPQKRIDRR